MDVLNVPMIKADSIHLRDLLVVGFNDSGFKVLNKYKNGSVAYRLKRIDSPFKAYHWLKDRIDNFLPEDYPKGIVCDLNFLLEDNYRFLNQVIADPILQTIPFIAISTDGTKINVQEALKLGIDDCYELQGLKWNNLKRRIEFLQRFKSEIKNDAALENETYEYNIPTGKRIFDVVVASLLLLALSPLFIVLAILIKLESKGSVFYSSKRAGSGFQVFDFIKFRSMCQDADAKLVQLSHLNQYGAEESNGPAFVKLQNDPRVTRVGKFIRKTSIDELPQLINVLKGDMSIVGNRPLPLYEADLLTKDEWSTRFIAPSGLTGLWQISKRGKSNMSTEERIKLDIDYAKDYSVMMDLKILMKTLPAMIQEEQV